MFNIIYSFLQDLVPISIAHASFNHFFNLLLNVQFHGKYNHANMSVTHIKGRQLAQALVLYNRVPFRNGNFS